MYKILKTGKHIKKLKKLFFLMDESQDLHIIILEIFKLILDRFCAIGDPKQRIFSFQGFDIDFIDVLSIFSPQKIYLTKNFRSSDNIVALLSTVFAVNDSTSNFVIQENEEPICLVHSKNIEEMFFGVIKIINKEISDNRKVAVLGRSNFIINEFSKFLKIPHYRKNESEKTLKKFVFQQCTG